MKQPLAFVLFSVTLSGCSTTKSHAPANEPLPETVSIEVTQEDRELSPAIAWNHAPLEIQDGSLSLSIEDAVFTALQRNRDLRIQSLEPVIAGAFERIERGAFQPELFATLQAEEEEVSETARATGEQFSVSGRGASGEVGIRQSLPTGTDLELAVEQDRSISSRTPEQQGARLGLSVTQSLLRGFGPTVNLAALRQARIGTLASRYELRAYAEAFVAEVETAYWNFALAREEIAIFESSLELARQELEEIVGRIEVGSLSHTDGAVARSEVALRESALVDARSFLADQRYRLARLLNASGDESLNFEIEATSSPNLDTTPIDQLDARIEVALRHRPDLNEARLRLEQERLETAVTRNGLLPRLDLFITLGKTGYADTFLQSFENIQEDSYDATAGLRFSQLIGNAPAEGRHLIARAARAQAAEAVLNHEQIVRLDVRLAANEVERARQQIHATAEVRSHLEEVVDGEVERLKVGSSTALQVAQTRRDLLETRIQEVEALISYRIALIELYLAEGTLLQRRGITIPGDS